MASSDCVAEGVAAGSVERIFIHDSTVSNLAARDQIGWTGESLLPSAEHLPRGHEP